MPSLSSSNYVNNLFMVKCLDGVAGIMPIITCPSCNSTNARFVANTRLFGFVWCRLLCRHLGFDLDFVQISGLKIGGWQHCHLLAFLLCRRCNSPSSWCLSRRQPCPPYSPSRLWPLLRSHQVPLIPRTDQSLNIFPFNTHFSDCKVKWNDHPVKWMFSLPPSAVA